MPLRYLFFITIIESRGENNLGMRLPIFSKKSISKSLKLSLPKASSYFDDRLEKCERFICHH